VLVRSLARALADLRAGGLGAAPERLGAMVREPALHLVLTPFRLLLEPIAAGSTGAWVPPFLVATGVLALHYIWLQRTEAAFEETAAAEGASRADRTAAIHAGGLARLRFSRGHRPQRLARPWLPLHPLGAPAYGVLWKNLLYAQRLVRRRTLLLLLVGAAALAVTAAMGAESATTATRNTGLVLLMIAAAAGFAGPLAVRLDLRVDLRHIELLRTLPVAGRAMMAAQIGGAAIVISLLQLPLAVAGCVLLYAAGNLSLPITVAAVSACLLCLPLLNALSVSIQNAIALLYPGWTRVGAPGSGGVEAVGQNMLTMIGTLLLLGISLLPPLLLAGAAAAAVHWQAPGLAAPVAVIAGSLALAAEILLIGLWLGGMYDRTDPVEAGLL
jgi:ABC-2 type transport system permease protein